MSAALCAGFCLQAQIKDQPGAKDSRGTQRAAKTYRNPIIDAPGAADPTVIRYKDKYYLYPTFDSRGYEVFVSDDLVHWERKPKCYTNARGGVWAPDVFHNEPGDGRFCLYYTADNPAGGKLIGVAVADDPLGPFKDQGTLGQLGHRCALVSR